MHIACLSQFLRGGHAPLQTYQYVVSGVQIRGWGLRVRNPEGSALGHSLPVMFANLLPCTEP